MGKLQENAEAMIMEVIDIVATDDFANNLLLPNHIYEIIYEMYDWYGKTAFTVDYTYNMDPDLDYEDDRNYVTFDIGVVATFDGEMFSGDTDPSQYGTKTVYFDVTKESPQEVAEKVQELCDEILMNA